jgi:hypothetical protein
VVGLGTGKPLISLDVLPAPPRSAAQIGSRGRYATLTGAGDPSFVVKYPQGEKRIVIPANHCRPHAPWPDLLSRRCAHAEHMDRLAGFVLGHMRGVCGMLIVDPARTVCVWPRKVNFRRSR